MRDRKPRTANPYRPDTTVGVPDPQARALLRRKSLDEQQREFQGTIPQPHLFRRRPPA